MLRNPGITVVVCQYCSSTLYREAEVLRAGKQSIVGEPRGDLAVGAQGHIGDLRLEIVGRVRFDHGGGTWDEWYGIDSGGRDHWIVEDEKSYALERPAGPVDDFPRTPVVGDVLHHMGKEFQVDDVGTATCVGGEGMLPRWIQPGESYGFVDLTEVGGDTILAVELSEGAEAYIGRAVAAEDIDFPPREVVAGTPDAGPMQEARSLACVQCGAAISIPPQGDPVQTVACGSCGSLLALDEAKARVVGKNAFSIPFPFEVGDKGPFDGVEYEVVGRLAYRETDGTTTREYLLWARQSGYRWLEEYDGHYTLFTPTQVGPKLSELRAATVRSTIDCGGATYRMYEAAFCTLVHVDGALPWLARAGDDTEYYDLVDPPRRFSVEVTENREMERFEGSWVPAGVVFGAFGRDDRYRAPTGVGAAQPNPVGRNGRWVMRILTLFGLLNFYIACGTMGSGEYLTDSAFRGESLQTLQGYRGRGTWTSPTFTVPEDARVIGLRIQTDLANDWASLSAALVPEGSAEPIGFLEKELEYYSGHDSEGAWSEGSQDGASYAKAPPPGTYRLEVDADVPRRSYITVGVTVRERMTRWPMGIAGALLGFASLILLRRLGFESARWGDGEDD